MAGQANVSEDVVDASQSTDLIADASSELMEDAVGDLSVDDDGVDEAGDGKKVLFQKSTDIRRRIEERLEVKLIKDQLGIDDFDID